MSDGATTYPNEERRARRFARSMAAYGPFLMVATWVAEMPGFKHSTGLGSLSSDLGNLFLVIFSFSFSAELGGFIRHLDRPLVRRLVVSGWAAFTGHTLLVSLDLAVHGWSGGQRILNEPGSGFLHDAFLSPRILLWAAFAGIAAVIISRVIAADMEAAREERTRREAQDAALRARLAPHFLFNTLATLKAQLELDPATAEATCGRLAALFQQVQRAASRRLVPLSEELELVEAYLAIERDRLGRRLRVRVEVDQDVRTVPVPSLALQALVENAVKHGIAPSEQGGEVRISAAWNGPGSGKRLIVMVESPASPPGAGFGPSTGTGLAALRGRLARPNDLTISTVADRFRAEFAWAGVVT